MSLQRLKVTNHYDNIKGLTKVPIIFTPARTTPPNRPIPKSLQRLKVTNHYDNIKSLTTVPIIFTQAPRHAPKPPYPEVTSAAEGDLLS